MNRFIFYCLIVSCFFLFLSCSDKDQPTLKGAPYGHISAFIQSKKYEDTATCLLFQAQNIIRITSSTHYPKRIALITEGTSIGTYDCSSNTFSSITYYDESGIKYISSGSTLPSKITLTKVDLTNFLVSGTFEGRLKKENGTETIAIARASFTNLTLHIKP